MPMSREEIDAFLAEPHLCHFATIDSTGRPRVRPLWYLWREGVFWFTTRREARHTGRDLAANQRVAVSIASEDVPYRAVIAQGTPEVSEPTEELLLAISTRYGDPEAGQWASEAAAQPDRVVMRMAPEALLSWDYRREGTDGPKATRL